MIVVDDELDVAVVRVIRRWRSNTRYLRDIAQAEAVGDSRVPHHLLRLRRPTFVTIDGGFWRRRHTNAHPRYCIIHVSLRSEAQDQLPGLLRRLFRTPPFDTEQGRVGIVAHVRWSEREGKHFVEVYRSGADAESAIELRD